MSGETRIYTAGEKEHLAWLERKNTGVPLVEETQKEVAQMIQELGLKEYESLQLQL
jgi:LDH2 family malate/lactate/ureidoglycolate dehydrogenase